jgi:hypothetical protein
MAIYMPSGCGVIEHTLDRVKLYQHEIRPDKELQEPDQSLEWVPSYSENKPQYSRRAWIISQVVLINCRPWISNSSLAHVSLICCNKQLYDFLRYLVKDLVTWWGWPQLWTETRHSNYIGWLALMPLIHVLNQWKCSWKQGQCNTSSSVYTYIYI